MEAAGGFEPPNNGFADRRLNHLATPPFQGLTMRRTHASYPMCHFLCHRRRLYRRRGGRPVGQAVEPVDRAAEVRRAQVRVAERHAEIRMPEQRWGIRLRRP
jgi:hypothetical protein